MFKKSMNPITLKRLRRFREMKRAYFSFWFLMILYIISLHSELICNNKPLVIRFNQALYFPIFTYYPESTFIPDGKETRPDYKALTQHPVFKDNPDNIMIFPIFSFGPFESIDPDSIHLSDEVTLHIQPVQAVGAINIEKEYLVVKARQFDWFSNQQDIKGVSIESQWPLPKSLKDAIAIRFDNQNAPGLEMLISGPENKKAVVSLSPYTSRPYPPKTIRLTFREPQSYNDKPQKISFDQSLQIIKGKSIWQHLQSDLGDLSTIQDELKTKILDRFDHHVDDMEIIVNNKVYSIRFDKEDIRFPFRPDFHHPMGIDGAGRDVLARVLYGFRTSMTFGIILVVASMAMGIFFGSIQGYYGGLIDISGQRFTEIWSALPFLYIMILMGSVYGRSFLLLLICYGLFNWIGISYYIRAEFLRLRKQSFVEAAQCLGLKTKQVIFRHILPNALVPIITLFPFSLVGAIGSLAALDYLGFGLPPPTPSWGELLSQAQTYRWAWWLIVFPSIALFSVMLLGVFVGEGIRNAYDPKRYSRIE